MCWNVPTFCISGNTVCILIHQMYSLPSISVSILLSSAICISVFETTSEVTFYAKNTPTLSWCNRKQASCCCLFFSHFNASVYLPLCKMGPGCTITKATGLKKYKPERLSPKVDWNILQCCHRDRFVYAAGDFPLKDNEKHVTSPLPHVGCYLVSARQHLPPDIRPVHPRKVAAVRRDSNTWRSRCVYQEKLQVTTLWGEVLNTLKTLPSRPTTVCVAAMCCYISV